MLLGSQQAACRDGPQQPSSLHGPMELLPLLQLMGQSEGVALKKKLKKKVKKQAVLCEKPMYHVLKGLQQPAEEEAAQVLVHGRAALLLLCTGHVYSSEKLKGFLHM